MALGGPGTAASCASCSSVAGRRGGVEDPTSSRASPVKLEAPFRLYGALPVHVRMKAELPCWASPTNRTALRWASPYGTVVRRINASYFIAHLCAGTLRTALHYKLVHPSTESQGGFGPSTVAILAQAHAPCLTVCPEGGCALCRDRRRAPGCTPVGCGGELRGGNAVAFRDGGDRSRASCSESCLA